MKKIGIITRSKPPAMPRVDVIPFESEHRFMATLNHDHAGHGYIFVKGAPEVVLDMCETQRVAGFDLPLDHDYWRRASTDLAARALRLLAVAVRRVPSGKSELAFDDLRSGFTLLALFGSIDPPREEAKEAVAQCQSAGIRIKMITGDHAETARAIGAQLGIGLGGKSAEALDFRRGFADLRLGFEDRGVEFAVVDLGNHLAFRDRLRLGHVQFGEPARELGGQHGLPVRDDIAGGRQFGTAVEHLDVKHA